MSDINPRFQAARLVLALRQAGVTDHRVTEALETTPRDIFVPRPFEEDAWDNVELPIDCGQSMTRPVTIGMMLQALDAQKDHTVLEIGTGSGYLAGVLTRLTRRVYSIDRYRTLVDKARPPLEQMGVTAQVEIRHADGWFGWPEAAPFDRIILTASSSDLPADLGRQLAAGGIAVMPVERDGQEVIVRLAKQADGSLRETTVGIGTFTPLQPGIAREL
jgi:protein-L-isoaspartate(D-aspartate) O-methyltransferase